MAVWRLQVNTGGANVADCLQNHVAALWAGKVLAYLMGNYYDSKDTYEKLFDWIDEHKFKTGKYSYKEVVLASEQVCSTNWPQPLPVNI